MILFSITPYNYLELKSFFVIWHAHISNIQNINKLIIIINFNKNLLDNIAVANCEYQSLWKYARVAAY